MLDFTVGICLGIILGFFTLKYILRKIKVYLGATYTNGYEEVLVDNIKDNKVICFEVESCTTLEIDIILFVRQFKIKDIQGE